MGSKQEICILCAWRESCQKKFSLSGRDMRCPDFAKDISIQNGKTPDEQEITEEEKE